MYKTLLILLMIAKISVSQDITTRKKEFLLNKGVALSGYDPVSYFSNKPQMGRKEYTATIEGIKYHFATASNQNIFMKNHTKYEPQFGGWCAYAMGNEGEKVEIDPETYKIIDGKLFLFFHTFYKNTLTSWNKDEKNLKAKAYINWAKIIEK